jgi:hypothetical protein
MVISLVRLYQTITGKVYFDFLLILMNKADLYGIGYIFAPLIRHSLGRIGILPGVLDFQIFLQNGKAAIRLCQIRLMPS